MSMLGSQINELRKAARNIQGKLGRCLYRRKDVDEMQQVSGMLFEAANTIESLQDRLQENECDVVKSYGKHPVTNNEVVLYNCSKCGEWIGLSANYCGNCGARIRKGEDA